MTKEIRLTIENFHIISLSFNKADVKIRGKYSLCTGVISGIVKKMQEKGIVGFALSTCNRTEFYAYASSADCLIDLYCEFCDGSKEELEKYIQVYEGEDAVDYLFRVSSGLESQILGDFEIISQIKTWYNAFFKAGIKSSELERLVQTAIKISKKIKTQTEISSGATSVAFAAANYILNNVDNLESKKILLLGTGKIGNNTCENLVKHIQPSQIYLINRTVEKTKKLSKKYKVHVRSFSNLAETLLEVDLVIVATGANVEIVKDEMIPKEKSLYILDLSLPENVEAKLANRDNIFYRNIDQISKTIDKTLEEREKEIPKAETIVRLNKWEYLDWLESRKYVPDILAFKEKLNLLKDNEIKDLKKKNHITDIQQEILLTDKMIQKLSNYFAFFIRENPSQADNALEVMNKVFMVNIKK